MQKKMVVFFAVLTVVVIASLTVLLSYTINSVNEKITKNCFDELSMTAEGLAKDLHKTTDTDRIILSAMTEIIGSEENVSNDVICNILKSYNNPVTYISYLELLRPDNTMLDSDGTIRDVSSSFDFKRDAQRAPYISGIERSTLNADEKVIRHAIPVKKQGRTVYILYGVIRLSELADKYKTNVYDGNAFVYLLDGNTGDFILDTWHKSLGNIRDFNKRKMMHGYSFKKFEADMKKGINGALGFVSKTTGGILYFYYEPVGVNNWSVAVSVEQKYAMHNSKEITASMYVMTGVASGILLIYMICVSACLFYAYRQVKEIGAVDKITAVKNRNAFEEYIKENGNKMFSQIVCIYIDVNGLHEVNNRYGHDEGDRMLRSIAKILKSEFSYDKIYRIGGDEFVVLCEEMPPELCNQCINNARIRIEEQDYSIAVGVVSRKNECGFTRIIKQADEMMLENKRTYYKNNNLTR